MRKLIAILIALIIMVSASPAFAEEETEETAQPERTCVCNDCSDKEQTETVTDKRVPGETVTVVFVEVINEDGASVYREESFEIELGDTLEDITKKITEKGKIECIWGKCEYEINDIHEENIETEKYKPDNKDIILIRMTEASRITDRINDNENTADADITVLSVSADKVETARSSTAEKIAKEVAENKWGFKSEWSVIGLARSDMMKDEEVSAYCNRIAAYLENRKSSKLNDSLSTDNSRLILALTSIGSDPTDVNGYNLLEPLSDMDYLTNQGLSGPVWALIAFDSHNYEIPVAQAGKNQTTRDGIINLLISTRLPDGGWSYSGAESDVDMTCMVIQALTPYYSRPDVKATVDSALQWISSKQENDGTFVSGSNPISSETQSQVLVTLAGLGIDPESDTRFVKNDNNVIDGLMKFYVPGGGFKHTDKANSIAGQQAYYALTAYCRYKQGFSSLYNMNDVTLSGFKGKAESGDKGTEEEKQVGTDGTPSGKTRSLGMLSLAAGKVSSSLISEKGMSGSGDAADFEKEYNAIMQHRMLNRTLPWIYAGIAAMAALALVVALRRRNS